MTGLCWSPTTAIRYAAARRWALPALLMCQAVSGFEPFLPELRSAGCTPAKARSWSKSVNRSMSPISAMSTAAIAEPVPGACVRVSQGRRPPARCCPGRGGDPEHRPGGPAGRIVEQLTELGEAELDQAD